MDAHDILPRNRMKARVMAVFNNSTVQSALQTSEFRAVNVVKMSWDSGNLGVLTPFPKWFNVLDPISFYLNESYRGAMTSQASLNAGSSKYSQLGILNFLNTTSQQYQRSWEASRYG
jgi:hypothetical protein